MFPVQAIGDQLRDSEDKLILTVESEQDAQFVALVMNLGVLLIDDLEGDPVKIGEMINRIISFKMEQNRIEDPVN